MRIATKQSGEVDRAGEGQQQELNLPAKSRSPLRPLIARILLCRQQALPVLALATIPFCVLCLIVSVSDLRTYPGRDLRPKVAGARLLAAGLDPYDFNSPPPTNEYFRTNNLISFTPGLLLLYVPLRSLPYETQRTIYFCLDWIFAAAAFYLLQRNFCRTRNERYLCWIVYAVTVVCSFSFRIHLERGQYYVFMMLLTCCTAVSIKSKRTDWLSCIPSALLLILRPTYVLLLPVALICLGARKWTMRVLLITALLFLTTLQFGGVKRWNGFLQVVHQEKVDALEGAMNGCGRSNHALPEPRQLVDVVDGANYHTSIPSNAISGTLTGLYKSQSLSLCRVFSPNSIDRINSLCMLLILTGGLSIAFMARSRDVSTNILIAYMLLWPLIFEIFSPERYLYTAVMEAVPLILVLFDKGDLSPDSHETHKFLARALIVALGILAPVCYQIFHNSKQTATATSAIILLVFPLCMTAYCVYCIATSDKIVPRIA